MSRAGGGAILRMIPSTPTRSTRSSAERRFFSMLSGVEVPGPSWVFHSLNLSEHEYKLVGELDFVVLCPQGLLVLEVKGGGVECRDGVWIYTDRFNVEHRREEGPFRQAQSGMFSLRRRLVDELGHAAVRDLAFGFGVVLPDCAFDVHSVEWSSQMVLDEGRLAARSLDRSLHDLFVYWREKGGTTGLCGRDELARIAHLLRPDFDKVPSLQHRLDDLDQRMERLTDEQYERLDAFEATPRMVCLGGAGTGKTFVAAEMARRHAASGEKVLLTCGSSNLAAFLRGRLPVDGIDVLTVDEAVGRDCSLDPCDVLILDEAQDVLNTEALLELDRVLQGGLEHGVWRVFCDVNNQSGVVGRFEREALDYLRALGVTGELRRNCRNTHEIVLQTKLLTAADLGTPSAGHGLPVSFRFHDDEDEELANLEGHLKDLASQDVPLGSITLLSTNSFERSAARHLPRRWQRRLVQLDASIAAAWPVSELTFAPIADFKGLENRFIILLDFCHLREGTPEFSLVYVGMSRARAGLWIAMHSSLRPVVEALNLRNLPLVTPDLEVVDE